MNWKIRFRELTSWRLKNDEERTKNDEEFPHNRLRKLCESASAWIFFTKHIFSPITAEMHSQGVMNILKQSPLFTGKKGGACRKEASWGRFLSAPQLLSSPPFSYFMEKLRKPYGSVSDFIFIFFFPFTNIKWNMLTQGFRKFYESITTATEAPKTIFQQNVEELAT